jgi:uncharacterized membrane protein
MIKKDGKYPITKLAGPYGHPLHPILVTLPIGMWVGSLVFDFASHGASKPHAFVQGAEWLVGIGILGALLAALFGLMDLASIPGGTRSKRTGYAHMSLNLIVTSLFVISFVIRAAETSSKAPAGAATSWWLIALSIVALLILVASGWLGGRLVFGYGVRVSYERDQALGHQPMQPTGTIAPRRAA